MDIATAIGTIVGACTLLGFLIKGTNSLARIEVTMASLAKENDEHRQHRKSTDEKLSDHGNRLSNLETDVYEMNDRG